MQRLLPALCLAFALAAAPDAYGQGCPPPDCRWAEVIRVVDGDTVTASVASPEGKGLERLRVRLAGIDAPESDQPWGGRAGAALRSLALGRTVALHVDGTDRYGRTIAVLVIGGVDLNQEMVRTGNAWVYRRYAPAGWLPIETEARAARRGLWAQDAPVPPWQWRRGERP